MLIKLNLNWVTDVIGDEYKKWAEGDIVIIETQTGTGKTYFIKNVLIDYIKNNPDIKTQFVYNNRLLYVCNRVNLKRQLKRDLLKKFNLHPPSSLEELDKLTTIGNVTITSYQSLEESFLNETYTLDGFDLYNFTYLVFDECHYLFADSSFNNKTRLAYDNLLKPMSSSTKIFITATAFEIKDAIIQRIEKVRETYEKFLTQGRKINIYSYNTGIDYSYINTHYFKSINPIIQLVKNDNSDDKWVIFVSSIKEGEKIKSELGENSVFIKAGTSNDDLTSIINNNKFNKKVLIATKTLDNGINFEDDKIKHIVIMAWDRITFIQMLGRKRVNIEKAAIVQLYIPTRLTKSFNWFLNNYQLKQTEIDLLLNNPNEFNRKYDNNLKALAEYQELFYRDKQTGEWTVNSLGQERLNLDREFAEYMLEKFQIEGEFAFIKEQLSWLNLEDTFNEKKLISEVIPVAEISDLEEYLQNLYENNTVYLTRKDRATLIERINVRDSSNKNRLLKGIEVLNKKLASINLPYRIEEFRTSRIIEGNKKNFDSAWRISKK